MGFDINRRDVANGLIGFAVGGVLAWCTKNEFKRAYSTIKFINKYKAIEPVKMIIVVRSDLRISSGKLASQCAHAAVSAYIASKEFNPHVTDHWETSGQAKIIVRTEGEGEMELYKLADAAAKLNIITAIIRDAGHTQLSIGTPTAVGIGPAVTKELDKITGSLRLW